MDQKGCSTLRINYALSYPQERNTSKTRKEITIKVRNNKLSGLLHCDSSIPLILSHSILPYILPYIFPSFLSPPPIDRHTLHRHRQSDIHFSSFLPFIKTSPAAPESLHAQLGIYAWYFRTRPEANTHTTKAHTALEPESEAARRHLFNPLQYRNDDASLTLL